MRLQSPKHLKFIRTLNCLVCKDNRGCEAAHLRMHDPRFAKPLTGIGTKPDDCWVLPLCSQCHARSHSMGEMHAWQIWRIDPFLTALGLWINTGDVNAAEVVMRTARRSCWK